MCSIDDADMPSISRVSYPRAAKAYECCECKRIIAKGEQYRYVFMVCEGDPFTFRVCPHCDNAAEWLRRECGGYPLENLYEELTEHAQEYPGARLGILRHVVGMRRAWKRFDGCGLISKQPLARSVHDLVDA